MENILHNLNIIIIFVPRKRKIGRVIECAGLEIRYTAFWYRGFESLIFRKQTNDYATRAGRRHNCFLPAFVFPSHHTILQAVANNAIPFFCLCITKVAHFVRKAPYIYIQQKHPTRIDIRLHMFLRLAIRLYGFRLCHTCSQIYRIKTGNKLTAIVRNTLCEPETK